MFEVAGSGSGHAISTTGQPDAATGSRNRRASRGPDNMVENRENLPRGVYGIGVKQNSLEHHSSDGEDDGSDDDVSLE